MGRVFGVVYRCIAMHLIKKAEFSLHAGVAARIMLKALTALAGQALACIEDPAIIEKILTHLNANAPEFDWWRRRELRLRQTSLRSATRALRARIQLSAADQTKKPPRGWLFRLIGGGGGSCAFGRPRFARPPAPCGRGFSCHSRKN